MKPPVFPSVGSNPTEQRLLTAVRQALAQISGAGQFSSRMPLGKVLRSSGDALGWGELNRIDVGTASGIFVLPKTRPEWIGNALYLNKLTPSGIVRVIAPGTAEGGTRRAQVNGSATGVQLQNVGLSTFITDGDGDWFASSGAGGAAGAAGPAGTIDYSDRPEIFSGGADGALVLGATGYVMSEPKFFSSVSTLSAASGYIFTNGYPLRIQTLDARSVPTGLIRYDGNPGADAVQGNNNGGAGGAGHVATAYLGASGDGGVGGNAAVNAAGDFGDPGTVANPSAAAALGGGGGAGGPGGDSGNAGGAGGAGAGDGSNTTRFLTFVERLEYRTSAVALQFINGGTGGGGGGGGGSPSASGQTSGAGGGGGAGGGPMDVRIGKVITDGTTPKGVVRGVGGRGGNGASSPNAGHNVGGGGGGAGGGGSYGYAIVGEVEGVTVADFFVFDGGAPGSGAAGVGTGAAGGAGYGGKGGRFDLIQLSKNTASRAVGSAGATGIAGTCRMDLTA